TPANMMTPSRFMELPWRVSVDMSQTSCGSALPEISAFLSFQPLEKKIDWLSADQNGGADSGTTSDPGTRLTSSDFKERMYIPIRPSDIAANANDRPSGETVACV